MGYSAVVLTYRRVESLTKVVRSLLRQTEAPSLVVVVDNDPSRSAARVSQQLREQSDIVIEYVSVGENLGPAGGWQRGVAAAREHALRGGWVGIFDDDDPIAADTALHDLMCAARTADPRVAAIGLRGARLDRRRARLLRVVPPLGRAVEVDYLASNGAPLYRWEAVDAEGFFDSSLFFGFEDLDLGLRLKRAGWLCLALSPEAPIHIPETGGWGTPWREYYKSRALVVVCRRNLGWLQLAAVLVRSVGLGSVRLSLQTRSLECARARITGAFDGLRGHLGRRRYEPGVNPPK